jgi:8-oxo-dGTP pyrophosphatase MutT (NUDIX family)
MPGAGSCHNHGGMEPKPAATVIVARSEGDGVQVLALRRSETTRFLPGHVVFPGGAIEAGDRALAGRLFGDPSEVARACAVRELYEEAGLLLTADGPVARRPEAAIEALRFDPPASGVLVEVSRWVAPEFFETRYDARFFATVAPPGLRVTPDGGEIVEAWWARPADILEAANRGGASIIWPTLVTLNALARCRSVDDVLALRIEQVSPRR